MWGVWRFKSGFNGEVVHFIGAWDYPTSRLWYRLYTDMIPRYLDLLRAPERLLPKRKACPDGVPPGFIDTQTKRVTIQA
ncbi:MAG: peptidoglycan bridge formation glycyltransferase FemA/FemB family protein [Chloroflexota bacterium]